VAGHVNVFVRQEDRRVRHSEFNLEVAGYKNKRKLEL
jgi:hypothetical protein